MRAAKQTFQTDSSVHDSSPVRVGARNLFEFAGDSSVVRGVSNCSTPLRVELGFRFRPWEDTEIRFE